MEKNLPIWVMVILALGVMFLFDLPILRPLEASIKPVDDAVSYSKFTESTFVLSPGFAR